MNCPLCQTPISHLPSVFTQRDAILSAAVLPNHPNANSGYGQIDLVLCPKCDFVFNRGFDEKKVARLYADAGYTTKSSVAPSMSKGLQTVRDFLAPHFSQARVLEIGSGNGAMAASISRDAREVVTVDPSKASAVLANRNEFKNLSHIEEYFSAETFKSKNSFDLILARHLLEHLPDPRVFINAIESNLASDGKIYIEVPNLDEILKAGRFYDIFHDHFGYYRPETLAWLCSSYGLRVVGGLSLFGDQHRGILLERGAEAELSIKPGAGTIDFLPLHSHWRRITEKLDAASTGLHIWGAGAHGNALINYLNRRTRAKFVGCFDADPTKAGRYLQDSEAAVQQPSVENTNSASIIVIAASLYEKEIEERIRGAAFQGEILKTAFA